MASNYGVLKYVKKYRFNRTFIKNLIVVFIAVFIPVLLVCGIMYGASQKSLFNECRQMLKERSDKITKLSDEFFKSYDLMDLTLLEDVKVQNIQILSGSKNDLREEYKQVMQLINSAQLSRAYIKEVCIYSEINQCLVTADSCADNIDFTQQPWYAHYQNSKKGTVIYSGSLSQTRNDEITVMRIATLGNGETLGMAAVTVSVNDYFNMLGLDTADNKEIFSILDRNDTSIMNTCYELVGKNMHQELGMVQKRDMENAVFDDMHYIGSKSDSCYNDWQYLYLSRELLYQMSSKSMVNISIGMIMIALIMCVLVALYLSVKSFKPLDDIMGYLYEETTMPDLSYNEGDRDLSDIQKRVLSIVNYNQRLNDKMEKTLLILNKTQIGALQHQINPHFIYNTLEVIKWMVLDGEKNSAAANMIEKFAEVVRYGVDMTNYAVTLEKEIGITKNYVDILKIRYENRFEVIWDVDEDVLESKIVKLSLQPVIENAVYHGFKTMRRGGIICVRIQSAHDRILISVKDNGAGIKADALSDLKKRLSEAMDISGDQIGLSNLNMRIKLIYGEECGVDVLSKEGEGTEVILKMNKSTKVMW